MNLLISLLICFTLSFTSVRWVGDTDDIKEHDVIEAELFDSVTGLPVYSNNEVYVFSPRYGSLSKAFCKEGVKKRAVNGTRKCTVSFGWIEGKGKLLCSMQNQKNEEDAHTPFSTKLKNVKTFKISPQLNAFKWKTAGRTWIQVLVVLFLCVFGISTALVFFCYVMTKGQGNKKMREVAYAIRKGSYGFLLTQYISVAIVSIILAVVIFGLYCARPTSKSGAAINRFLFGFIVAVTFVFGVFMSASSGIVSMIISVMSNSRVAAAATRSYGESFRVALFGGGFISLLINTMAVLGVLILFVIVYMVPKHIVNALQAPDLMVGFAFGAAFSGLFAQLGGGIFTKSADMAADLVGKTENALEEDDMRNPAVIADLVGDNVGDCAGRGADLFETITNNMIAVVILGTSMAYKAYPEINADRIYDYALYPILALAFGLVASFFGIMAMACLSFAADVPLNIDIYAEENKENEIKKEGGDDDEEEEVNEKSTLLDNDENERKRITKEEEDGEGGGHDVSGFGINVIDEEFDDKKAEVTPLRKFLNRITEPNMLMLAGFIVTFFATSFTNICVNIWCFVGQSEETKYAWLIFSACGIIGIFISCAISAITFLYTDYALCPTIAIAKAAQTGGPANNIITGVAYGMQSTLLSSMVIGGGMLCSFWLGKAAGYYDENEENIGGIFGIGAATLGMIATSPFILALDTFGPIADNAGGIVEMSGLPNAVRVITDKLDAVGNTVKALTKGYAMATACLAATLVIFAFMDIVSNYTQANFFDVNIASTELFVAGLCGAVTVFIFVAVALQSVSTVSVKVMKDIKRQFRQNPDILDINKPDLPNYASCVSKCARYSLLYMMLPGFIGVFTPLLVGFAFRLIGWIEHNPLLGVQAGLVYLIFSTIVNVLMGIYLTNTGGAWDNAKKYVETGKLGGKHTDTHNAVIIGDTVGDPFKDTAGPSLNILVTLVATVTLVIGPLWINEGAIMK